MIPILYSNVEEALGGTWTEKKGTFQKNYYWNCETDTAVLTAYTGSYTAYAAIAVTPGKLYHIHAVRGTSSKSRVLLFAKSDYTILWKLEASSSPVDRDVIAPANAAYALITAGTKNDTYLNNTEFKEFSTGGPVTNGLGRISDCISCLVTEERNGKYEAEFTYPVSGIHYEDIQKVRVISVTHDETGTRQPFVIYRASAPINGMVTYNAHHASYALSNAIVQPFTATSVADAFDQLVTKCMTINPFIFWTDNVTAGTMTSKVPASVRSLLGGTRGSILDVFGGEYEFDGYTVKNHASRGSDKGVTIRYGKNLTDIEDTSDISETYNAVVPYWSDGQDTVVFGGIITAAGAEVVKAIALDLSGEWEEAPTVSDLEARAATYLSNNTPWIQKQNIKIDFVALWQTEEYKNIAPLERVTLCDTVHVIHPELDINVTAKVIKTTWDVLADRYDSIELGEAKSSFADTILDGTKDALSTTLKQYAKTSAMTEAIDHATQLITGGLGGYIVFTYNADGEPTEMLIMNTPDVETATKVMRFNNEGIGYSTTGYQGPFTSAWTLSDGAFVADFITAGHMSCNRIQGGTLTLGGVDNGNGVLVVYDASGNELGRIDNTAILLKNGNARAFCGTEQNFYYSALEGTTWGDVNGFSINNGTTTDYVNEIWTTGYNNTVPQHSATTPKTRYVQTYTIGIDNFDSLGRPQTYKFVQDYIGVDSNDEIYFQKELYSSSGSIRALVYLENEGFRFTNNGSNTDNVHITVQKSKIDLRGGSYTLLIDSTHTQINGQNIAFQGSSSKRYKHAIASKLDANLDPKRLYDLKVMQFIFNAEHPLQYEDMRGEVLPGFIAEDVEEIYPAAVIHDREGNVENWDERRILPGMLALIQEQKKTIDEHETRIKELEEKINRLTEAIGVYGGIH